MIPQDFITFFAASLTADGALIGLLFVAISIQPERTFGEGAELDKQLAANASFNGLVNNFLISMIALIPRVNIGVGAAFVAGFSLLNTIIRAVDMLRSHHQNFASGLTYTIGAIGLYSLELWYGGQLIQYPKVTDNLNTLIDVLIVIYIYALSRSWSLLGAERRTFLGSLMGALRIVTLRGRSDGPSSTHSSATTTDDTTTSTHP